jgi:endonuclease YncB( thermonuclease family)
MAKGRREVLTASVLKIVDGDTIDVWLEGCTVRVRSIGVNTPEMSHPIKGAEPFGKEAKKGTRRMVESRRSGSSGMSSSTTGMGVWWPMFMSGTRWSTPNGCAKATRGSQRSHPT